MREVPENIKPVLVKYTVRKEYKTIPIYQYDVGHILTFEGFNLPEAFEVHFALSDTGDAVTQIGSNDQVAVPDVLVEDGRWLYAWIYVADEDTGLTKFVIQIPVVPRAKPTHQTPSPVEQSEITQAIADLNDGVARAEQAADDAEAAQEAAETARDEAVTAKNAAEQAAQTATEKAEEASASASNAGQSATAAAGSASEAHGYAQSAASASQAAAQSARATAQAGAEADRDAKAAAASAATASAAAQTATTKAGEAGQSATQAAGSAATAGNAATAAAGSATEAGQEADRAEQARDAAETALDDALEEAAGYVSQAQAQATLAAGSASAAGQSATAASGSAIAAAESAAEAEQIKDDFDSEVEQLESDVSDLKSAISQKIDSPETPGTAGQVLGLDSNLAPVWTDQTGADESGLAPVIKNTASGEIASFSDGADGRQIDSLIVNIEPVQSGSGDPSPENIRPITGWTGCEVNRAGINLLNKANGSAVGSNWWIGSNAANGEPDGTFSLSAGTYTVSVSESQDGIYIRKNGANVAVAYSKTSITFTLTETTPIKILLYKSNSAVSYLDTLNIQLEPGSIASPYTPYTGTTLPISWQSVAGTVYGGTLDVISGVLTVTWAEYAFTGNEAWMASSTAHRFYVSNFNVYLPKRIATQTQVANAEQNAITSVFGKCVYKNADGVAYFTFPSNVPQFVINESAAETVDDIKSIITGTQLVYELETPIVYQLTPNQLSTLLGQNNLWSNCGSISSVQYSADTKTYVDDSVPSVPVQDVQVNSVSVLTDGVANVPIATNNGSLGVVIPNSNDGIGVTSAGKLYISTATYAQIKAGTNANRPITSSNQEKSTFYGLAKAAGDSTQSSSSNVVGNYTDSAKSAIHTMLNGSVAVAGTTPTITALPGIRYVCGEVSTLTVNLPASGIVDVVFESGSTATVLTITPPTGVTLKWANGFDPTALDANTVYEINIADGLGVAASWT